MTATTRVPATARIVIAAPMKSGSTFVANAVRRILRAPDFELEYDWLSEQNLTYELREQLRNKRFAINLHILPHTSNLAAAAAESITLIPLWRNLADMVVSYEDHIPRYGAHNPIFYAPENLMEIDQHARHRYLIDGLVPWNLGFYLRWRDLGACFQSYETLAVDPHGYLRYLLWRLGVAYTHDDVLRALQRDDRDSSRFNSGTIGRSARLLDADNRARVERHIVDHPRFDELEVLLWELPWTPTQIERRSLFDGCTVRASDDVDAQVHFVSRGVRHRVSYEWLMQRPPTLAAPQRISAAALAALPEGIALV